MHGQDVIKGTIMSILIYVSILFSEESKYGYNELIIFNMEPSFKFVQYNYYEEMLHLMTLSKDDLDESDIETKPELELPPSNIEE